MSNNRVSVGTPYPARKGKVSGMNYSGREDVVHGFRSDLPIDVIYPGGILGMLCVVRDPADGVVCIGKIVNMESQLNRQI
jgi:hypothetical protein